MLTIRDGQIAALGAARLSEFQSKAVTHVRDCFPDVCAGLSDADLKLQVVRGIARGQHHGLDDQADLLRFLNVMFSLGQDFENRYPWAPQILEDHRFAALTRLDLVVQRSLAELERPRHRAEVELVFPEPPSDPEDAAPFDGLPLDDGGATLTPLFEEGNFEPMATLWTEVSPSAGDDDGGTDAGDSAEDPVEGATQVDG
jgi:hypothetical protein